VRRRWLLGLGALIGTFGAGCGWNAPPEGELAVLGLPIINGTPADGDEHMAVVAILSGPALCTGTLINRDVVMTAGHCVDPTSLGSYSIRFARQRYQSPIATRAVSERLRHPLYNRDYVLNDIALLRLDEPAPADIVPIPPLPEYLRIAYADVGEPIDFVGFGMDEDGGVGVKLKFTGEVKWLCDGPDACPHSNWVYGMPKTLCFDQAEGGTCQGDSGGPALVVRDQKTYVAGITSYGDDSGCSIYGCSTKVDGFEDFIVGFTGGGVGEACTADGDCLWGNCVEGVCCNAACDSPCTSCRQPGREGYCEPADNGTACPDGDLCNGDEVCILGRCVPGTPLDCADQDPCTSDVCTPAQGCLNELEPDGFECGEWMMCQAGACVEAKRPGGGCATAAGSPAAGAALLACLVMLLGLAVRRGV